MNLSKQQKNIFVLAALLFSLAGCAKMKTESGGGHAGSGSNNGNSSVPSSAAASANARPTTWEATATSLNAATGQTFTLACSPGGTAHSVWGSDIYTADSSICTAAVHSGLITLQQGGTVTIEMRPGRSIYGTSERNGVTSSGYGAWQSSFVFKAPNSEAAIKDAEEQTAIMWNTSGGMLSGDNGSTWKFKCPPNGKESSVWGTDIYTIDSSICNAAVHVGRFSSETGGSVTVELRDGESSYKGSARNGVTTKDYGPYGRSFAIK